MFSGGTYSPGRMFSGGTYSLEADSLLGGYSPGRIISGHMFSGRIFSGADVLGAHIPSINFSFTGGGGCGLLELSGIKADLKYRLTLDFG